MKPTCFRFAPSAGTAFENIKSGKYSEADAWRLCRQIDAYWKRHGLSANAKVVRGAQQCWDIKSDIGERGIPHG